MCSECGRAFCPSGCPNAEEPEVVVKCSKCGAGLVCGDEAYKIDDKVYCEVCVSEAMIIIE